MQRSSSEVFYNHGSRRQYSRKCTQNDQQKKKCEYIALFQDGSQVDNEDEIVDYWSEDTIFYASTTYEPPTEEFMDDVIHPKAMRGKKDNPPPKVGPPKPVSPPKVGPPKPVSPPKVGPPKPFPLLKVGPPISLKLKYPVRKYIFYFTGSNKEHLMNGIEVGLTIDTVMNPDATRTKLLNVLRDANVDMNGKQLIIYLSGGIPFTAGTIEDFFLEMKYAERHIYGIITRPIADSILNQSCLQICDVSDADHKLFISPLCNSSERGLCEMACLLGYLNNYGFKGNLLLKAFAATIHFPPLLTSLNRIIERNQVIYRDVVTVCSTLFTYFRIYLPKTISDDKVFEYSLRMCNLITNIRDIPEKIPMMKIEIKPSGLDTNYLRNLKLRPIVYYLKKEIGLGFGFKFVDLEIQNFEIIENAYNSISSFTPIAPLSMRIATECSIVRGKDHEYLYLMQSTTKDTKSQNKVCIIDPKTGLKELKDVENFAQEQFDDSSKLIDPYKIEQIIMVNLNESKYMINEYFFDNDKNHRITIAFQYLTSFVNRIYGYHLPCIQGLVSFNNQIKVKCPLSPLISDFEDKGLKNINIQQERTERLWDSLVFSCDEIVKFRKDNKGKEIYYNAQSRILVISDGEDLFPEVEVEKVEEVVKKLIKNEIIVDSIIIKSKYECKMLCAVCHATGGLSFKPETVSKGLSLIEQDAFINICERKNRNEPLIPGDRSTTPSNLSKNIELINEKFMKEARNNAKFDTNILNKELLIASANVRLATPRHVCARLANTQIPLARQRRILIELHVAAETNDISIADRYDPDMKIYTFQANFERWKVFLKGPEGTPYENKWWYLYVTFPELYPVQPPNFRFVSIPYHINVSSDGKICFDNIEKGYISSKHVVDIIQEIKELFLLPNVDTPIQIEIYDKFKNNPTQYERLARESSENNAKDKIEDYIDFSPIIDEVPKEFNLEFNSDDHIPPYMMSQISGEVIRKKKMVMASSGVYYDKEELKQLVASCKKPICVITGKVLTERPEDFTDSDDPDAI